MNVKHLSLLTGHVLELVVRDALMLSIHLTYTNKTKLPGKVLTPPPKRDCVNLRHDSQKAVSLQLPCRMVMLYMANTAGGRVVQ